MNSFGNIFIWLSCFSIFLVLYSLLWGFTRENFKVYKHYYHIFIGFLFCIVSILTSFILGIYNTKNKYSELLYYIPFILYFISINFISFIPGSLLLITNSIIFMKLYGVSNYINVNYDSSFKYFILFIYLLVYALRLIKLLWNKIDISVGEYNFISIFLILISFLTFRYGIHKEASIKLFSSLIFILFLYLSNFCCMLIEQTFKHAIKLQNIVKYEENHYLNSENINFAAMQFLKENKTNIGFYLNFFILDYDDFDAILPPKIKQSIILSIADSFYQSINSSIENKKLFFKNNRKTYGVFIDTSEDFSDKNKINEDIILNSEIISKLNQAINNVWTRFRIDEYNIKLNIASVLSVYGVQSNDFDQLYAINDWFIRREKNLLNKKLLLTNNNEYINEKKVIRNIMILNENVNINAFNINYDPIYDIKSNNYMGYISKTIIDGEEIEMTLKNELYKKIDKISMTSTFVRYIAYKQLNSLNKNTVSNFLYYITYDSLILSSNEFDILEFSKKFKFNNVKASQIVLCLNVNAELSELDVLEKNIDELKKIGFKICINDFDISITDSSLIGYYKPDFIFIDFSSLMYMTPKQKNEFVLTLNYLSKKINCSLIYTRVRKYTDYVWLREHNIKYISGQLIGSNLKNNIELSEDLKFLLQKV